MLIPSAMAGCALPPALPTKSTPCRSWRACRGKSARPPAMVRPGAHCEGFAHADAGFLDMSQDGFARIAALGTAQRSQPIAPHATRHADTIILAAHHAPIAARKREQRHQTRRQSAPFEVTFEPEQIGGRPRRARRLRWPAAGMPRTMRGHDDARRQHFRSPDVSFDATLNRPRPAAMIDCTFAGCRICVPAARAWSSSNASKRKRDNARPHSWLGKLGAVAARRRQLVPAREQTDPPHRRTRQPPEIAAPTPSRSRSGKLVADRYSPQTFGPGNS